jgi:succinate dehydrogenase / fumarate reductase, cytochrome b subunit
LNFASIILEYLRIMTNLFEFLNSSVGKKWLMALTGLFLSLFLIVHVSGNLALFKDDGGLAFNQYTVFMTTFPPIKVISYLLYATIIIHAINGFYLVAKNMKARPVKYEAKKNNTGTTWASRNMGILGTILLIFIATHLIHFWYEYKFGEMDWKTYVVEATTDNILKEEVTTAADAKAQHLKPATMDYMGNKIIICKDLYGVVATAFKDPLVVAFYVISMLGLSYHLLHGFQSAFQTLSIRGKNYQGLIKGIGTFVFAIIIPALFAAMPIYFLTR